MIRPQEEEVINATTHFISAIITFLITFLVIFVKQLTVQQALPVYIMGLTATWTFWGSYLYHSSYSEPKRGRNRLVDKTAIYLMIAGSGSGMCLAGAPSLLSIVCCLLLFLTSTALIINLCVKKEVSETFSVTSYILMGWLAVIPASGIFTPCIFTSGITFLLVLAGGIAYSIGVVFYVGDSRKWYHTIWHILVMIGFSFHFLAVTFAIDLFQ